MTYKANRDDDRNRADRGSSSRPSRGGDDRQDRRYEGGSKGVVDDRERIDEGLQEVVREVDEF